MLVPACPHCSRPTRDAGRAWRCSAHGPVAPLWRSSELGYHDFAELLAASPGFPVLLPWPMGPGWRVSEAAVVADRIDGSGGVQAWVTGCSGTSALDGAVDVFVVTEAPGTGLGCRVAGIAGVDPGPDVVTGPPAARVHVDSHTVGLWSVSTSGAGVDLDRSVLVGEYAGRWLWLVLRPASAMLLLRDDWILRDVSAVGPQLVDLPFGGPGVPW